MKFNILLHAYRITKVGAHFVLHVPLHVTLSFNIDFSFSSVSRYKKKLYLVISKPILNQTVYLFNCLCALASVDRSTKLFCITLIYDWLKIAKAARFGLSCKSWRARHNLWTVSYVHFSQQETKKEAHDLIDLLKLLFQHFQSDWYYSRCREGNAQPRDFIT